MGLNLLQIFRIFLEFFFSKPVIVPYSFAQIQVPLEHLFRIFLVQWIEIFTTRNTGWIQIFSEIIKIGILQGWTTYGCNNFHDRDQICLQWKQQFETNMIAILEQDWDWLSGGTISYF